MNKIEFNSKEIEKKFNSPEWKKKMKELEELEKSPEYKELREKYEKEVEELKKKKGISTDKAFLIYDPSNAMKLAALPASAVEVINKVFVDIPNIIVRAESRVEPVLMKTLSKPSTN
ncbi:hypothetical protein D3C85_1527550 [compost metagenome]